MVAYPSAHDMFTGLSEAEARDKLRAQGYNELPTARARSSLAIVAEILRDPIFILLVAGGALYLILGDVQEALILLGFVVLLMGITWYQERKTERALEALRDLSSPRALIIREGRQRRIAGREVVDGDIVVLKEGDRVPADGVLLARTHLSVDESILTGESIPVRKGVWDGHRMLSPPGGDDLPFVYAGTLVVQGQGVAQVQAIGIHTAVGAIGKALQTVEPEETPLQRDMAQLVRRLALVGGGLCVAVVLGYGLTRGHWLDGILAGVALAMAILPNEFPVVLVIFLALGAWRIAHQHVLTRRMPAVEALGATTVLCVDKTGTLTLNRMAVRQLRAADALYTVESPRMGPLPEPFHELVEFSLLASQRDPFDPMEQAVTHWGEDALAQTEHLHRDWTVVREYPLSPQLLAMSLVWRSPAGPDYVIAAKGAPEAIVDLCHLGAAERKAVIHDVRAMAGEGLRVLGVAKAAFTEPILPGEQHDFPFAFVGLIGLADPVRPTVPAALQDCYAAGIRVLMITGDYPGTAQSIGRQVGLVPGQERLENVLTGADLERMDEPTLQRRLRDIRICARVVPCSQASYRERPEAWRRRGGHDRRWGQRCAGIKSCTHRRGHGRARHRRGARGRRSGAPGRRFFIAGGDGATGAPGVR